MNNTKLKHFLFNIFGISLFILGIFVSYLSSTFGKENHTQTIVMSLFIFVVWNLITAGFISSIVFNSNKTIFNYILHIRYYFNLKWVFHDKLGYFPLYIRKNKIILHKQSLFITNKLTHINTNGKSVDEISKEIKEYLDNLYKEKLKSDLIKNLENSKTKEIKDWDGFLDKTTRRDRKIDDILK